jgi:uncharacterized protein (DUF1330 family)
MAKGYWIANVDVRNADGYKEYVAALPNILRKFGGRYATRGGKTEVVEGKNRSRVVVLGFPVMSRQWPAIARRNMPRRSHYGRRMPMPT